MTGAVLILEDGTLFHGRSIGAHGTTAGEVVFHTGMSGYQEILTDPSYCGQIVTMTYPHIGNTGVNDEDVEASRLWVNGFIVKESSAHHSNHRAQDSLGAYLARHGIVGIDGIDTRALTKLLRTKGALRGIITTEDMSVADLRIAVQNVPDIGSSDLTAVVTAQSSYTWDDPGAWSFTAPRERPGRFRVAVLDFGIKQNILRRLAAHGCSLTVLPASATPDDIAALRPDGLFLSNGPGDPAAVWQATETVKAVAGTMPIFGICLGHQILGIALGAKTYKLKFGHHGANHPVMNLRTRRIEITSQNHGFAVDPDSLPSHLELTHINLNDRTVEGFRHRDLPIFCVQYHPEASPGPHDSDYLFREFIAAMEE
jgi:carbamoyl-phosphate synthase small subunit